MFHPAGLLPSPTTTDSLLPALSTLAATISSASLSSWISATAATTAATAIASSDELIFSIQTAPAYPTALPLPTAFPLVNQSHDGGPKQAENNGECELLGPFALLIQGSLGLLAMLSLVWKRYRERPQRPLKIWFFDASKQVFGSVLVHVANLLMSMLSAGKFTVAPKAVDDFVAAYQPNPCSFYLLNLAIDTTLGIPILIFLLRIFTLGLTHTPFGRPPQSIQSGNYGHPHPRTWWWFKQSLIYFMGLLGMKLCVLFIFTILPWISRIGDWALRWTEGNEMVQVFFVMLLFPVIMNAIQYYIIDSFIKDQGHGEGGTAPGEDEGDGNGGGEEYERLAHPRDSLDSEAAKLPAGRHHEDYDPRMDGEESPTAAGSGSSTIKDGPSPSGARTPTSGDDAKKVDEQ